MDERWLDDNTYIERCLSGECLFGNDFSAEALTLWHSIEAQAHARLDKSGGEEYGYHALDRFHALRKLPDRFWGDVLSYGGAYCFELVPILEKIGVVTVLEPGDRYWRTQLEGKALTYVKPEASGTMPFRDEQFDLITCFSALHHVPNVSYVVEEFARTLKQGGYGIIREPSTSMEDWTRKRMGLTPCERGIPPSLMKKFIKSSGCEIVHVTQAVFSPLRALATKCGIRNVYNNAIFTRIDAVLSNMFSRRHIYHPKTFFQKFQPGVCVYVFRKCGYG